MVPAAIKAETAETISTAFAVSPVCGPFICSSDVSPVLTTSPSWLSTFTRPSIASCNAVVAASISDCVAFALFLAPLLLLRLLEVYSSFLRYNLPDSIPVLGKSNCP